MIEIIYSIFGVAGFLLLGLLLITSIRELHFRAIGISAGMVIVFVVVWTGSYLIFKNIPVILLFYVGMFCVFILLFFIPSGKIKSIYFEKTKERVDEKDTMFAREEYYSGSEKYKTYYAEHPELKAIDNKIRKLPELLAPGGRYFDPARSRHISSIFSTIESLTDKVDGKPSDNVEKIDSIQMTHTIKELVINMGADEVGIARLNPAYIYSHVGRGIEPWGQPIDNKHRYAIVFSLEMAHEKIDKAPLLPVTEETALKYLNGATLSIVLAKFIRNLGYPARAHISGSNYQIMLPPVAYDAGIGELGRMGYLISPRFGARIRLGAVTTDLPLVPDKPIAFGVQDFCEKCLKCAINCPSNAIPKDSKKTVRGVEKWQINIENCLRYWRIIGTDCGLCMKVCPFSHPQYFLHNIVRYAVSKSAFARTVSIYGDDLLYGRKIKHNNEFSED